MVNGTKLEIYDTGAEDKGGSIVYTRADTGWVNLYATSLKPEINLNSSDFDAKRVDSEGYWGFEENRIKSMRRPRFTIPCSFPIENLTDYEKVLNMSFSLGLKKIKGGLGTLSLLQGNESGEVYVIIVAIQISETLSTSTDTIKCTLTLEMV